MPFNRTDVPQMNTFLSIAYIRINVASNVNILYRARHAAEFEDNKYTFFTILALGYEGGDILQIGSPLENISQIVVASAHMSACGLRFADSRFE